jgi:hypothetical protein
VIYCIFGCDIMSIKTALGKYRLIPQGWEYSMGAAKERIKTLPKPNTILPSKGGAFNMFSIREKKR